MGMIRKPRCCNPAGTEPPALFGSRDAPTTAITLDASRISRPVLLTSIGKPARGWRIPGLDAEQRLACRVTADLLARETVRTLLPLRHRARDMGGDEHVRRSPEWMVGRQRLRVRHVKRGADAAGSLCVQQSLDVDSWTATRIHQQRA